MSIQATGPIVDPERVRQSQCSGPGAPKQSLGRALAERLNGWQCQDALQRRVRPSGANVSGSPTGSRTRAGLGRCRCELEMLFAWIGGGDHDTDGFLVEALEPAVPLQVLQVTAKGAFFDELIELLAGDQAGRQKAL